MWRGGDTEDGREEGQLCSSSLLKTQKTLLRETEKKGGLQLKEGRAMAQRSLSSESDQAGHPCSQERAAKTPELSISTSEGTWRSAGCPGGPRRKDSEVDRKVSEPMKLQNRAKGLERDP